MSSNLADDGIGVERTATIAGSDDDVPQNPSNDDDDVVVYNQWHQNPDQNSETLEDVEHGNSNAGLHRYRCDNADVAIPENGTLLAWLGPSILNAESLKDVLFSTYNPDHPFPAQAARPVVPRRLPPAILKLSNSPENGEILCGPPSQASLRLDELLAVGTALPTQVFHCTPLFQNVESGTGTLVLKLFTDQNEKMPSKRLVTQEEYEERDWGKPYLGRNAQKALCSEADIFKSLAPIQGFCVPYSLGFYEFTLPCGTTVVGHLQEYVPSIDISSYYQHVIKPDKALVDLFLSNIHQAFIDLHRCDVAHRDIALRNLRLLPHVDPYVYDFVIVDLSLASSIRYSERDKRQWQGPERAFFQLMLEEELDEESIWEYMETENGKKMWALFHMGPDELIALESSTDTIPAQN